MLIMPAVLEESRGVVVASFSSLSPLSLSLSLSLSLCDHFVYVPMIRSLSFFYLVLFLLLFLRFVLLSLDGKEVEAVPEAAST